MGQRLPPRIGGVEIALVDVGAGLQQVAGAIAPDARPGGVRRRGRAGRVEARLMPGSNDLGHRRAGVSHQRAGPDPVCAGALAEQTAVCRGTQARGGGPLEVRHRLLPVRARLWSLGARRQVVASEQIVGGVNRPEIAGRHDLRDVTTWPEVGVIDRGRAGISCLRSTAVRVDVGLATHGHGRARSVATGDGL